MDINRIIIERDLTVEQAFQQLDAAGEGVLLLIHDNKLERVITDGDLRRLVLTERSLSAPVSKLPLKKPIVAPKNCTKEMALDIMYRKGIVHLPIVDSVGEVISIFIKKDIEQKVYLSPPHMSGEEEFYVEEAFQSNWLAPLGPHVEAFEQELANFLGAKTALAVVSGTAALHLALNVLGIGPGDIVFCSSFTFVASANPILYQHATPVFIDSDLDTWNMSSQALEKAFVDAKKNSCMPKAVIVANIYGQSANYSAIKGLCEYYGVPIVEDAAESLGASYNGQQTGTFGKLGIFSFNGNKIITTSGGGAIVSDDASLIEKCRFLSTQARENVPHYEHKELGFNYRLSNVLAAIGRGQLKVLQNRVVARRKIFSNYQNKLSMIEWMPEPKGFFSSRWLSCGYIKNDAILAKVLVEELNKAQLEARRVWKPLHKQPLYKGCKYFPHEPNFSVSEFLFERGFCLPSGSELTLEQQKYIIKVVEQFSVVNEY